MVILIWNGDSSILFTRSSLEILLNDCTIIKPWARTGIEPVTYRTRSKKQITRPANHKRLNVLETYYFSFLGHCELRFSKNQVETSEKGMPVIRATFETFRFSLNLGPLLGH